MNKYLLEIGVEELPAKQITRVIAQLKESIVAELKEEKLPYGSIQVWSTPRRIAIFIDGIKDNLEDELIVIQGPNVAICYKDGEPTGALLGFLKKNNANIEDIEITQKGKNDVVSLKTKAVGEKSQDVISRLAPSWVTRGAFDKSMRWRDYNIQFARPIRWLLSLYNSEHLPVAIEGLSSDIYTFGHRTLANTKFKVTSADSYQDVMNQAKVVVEPGVRRDMILSQIKAMEEVLGVTALKDDKLLDEIINIVEYPTLFSGKFDEEFLALPTPTVVMPMKDHQRYFPTFAADGKLSVVFFGVRNGDDYFLDTVSKGNETVIRARLKDAQFFFAEDRKKPLEDFAIGLKTVLYQAKLGTIHDKVQRIKELSNDIAKMVKLQEDDYLMLNRTVDLCKADLNTLMVGEFAELQGVVGRIYAGHDGEPDAVAQAIESHYMPRFSDDDVPGDIFGKIISIADKMDSLVGSYGIGVTPKGGKDPFGLRRMMIGILSTVLAEDGFNPDLGSVISKSFGSFGDKLEKDEEWITLNLEEAFRQRLRIIMSDKGYRFDIIEATIYGSLADITAFIKKCDALAGYDIAKLEDITTNILRAAKLSSSIETTEYIDPRLFEGEAETKMYSQAMASFDKILPLVMADDYTSALDELKVVGDAIAAFLEDVMVMHENPKIRDNRKQIMFLCAETANMVADFEKLQFS